MCFNRLYWDGRLRKETGINGYYPFAVTKPEIFWFSKTTFSESYPFDIHSFSFFLFALSNICLANAPTNAPAKIPMNCPYVAQKSLN